MDMEKTIDLNRTVHALCSDYPELPAILAELGFTDLVTKPGMLETAGRFMTIPKGAKLKQIDLDRIIQRLEAAGFTVVR